MVDKMAPAESDAPLVCQWQDPPCKEPFTDPEVLYHHICDRHIGRKSTGNLTLRCKWKDCEVECVKRDHITSHLRVHTPLKPHNCEVCGKAFKRPQDLKKHERIHTEEHHVAHKHSKAITVPGGGAGTRDVSQHHRPFAPLPHHAQQHPPYPYPYGPPPSLHNGTHQSFHTLTGLSTAQLVAHQHDLNAQAAAQQAYQSLLVSSGFAAVPLQPGTPYPSGPYPAYPHPQFAGYHQPAYVAAGQVGGAAPQGMYPDLAALTRRAEANGTAAYPSVLRVPREAPTANTSKRGSSPYSATSGGSPHAATNGASPLTATENAELLSGHGGPRAKDAAGGGKRGFDEAADAVLTGLKKGKFSNRSRMDAFDTLSNFLLWTDVSAAPGLEAPRSNSSSSASSAASPHSSNGASTTPPSDLDWLADKSEADHLTNLLASIGTNIESAHGAAISDIWPRDGTFHFPGFEHHLASTSPPNLAAGSGSQPAATSAKEGEGSCGSTPPLNFGHIYPNLPGTDQPRSSAPALPMYPHEGISPHQPFIPVTHHSTSEAIHYLRGLPPARIAPFEVYNPTFIQAPPLHKAPPLASSIRTAAERMDLDDKEDELKAEGGKYGESVRSTSVKLPPLTEGDPSRRLPTPIPSMYPRDPISSSSSALLSSTSLAKSLAAVAVTPRKPPPWLSSGGNGTTLPPIRSLFGEAELGSAPLMASNSSTSSSNSSGFPRRSSGAGSSANSSFARFSSEDFPSPPSTADSLAGRVHGMDLNPHRSSTSRCSSPSISSSSTGSVVNDTGEDSDEDMDVRHKRSRLGVVAALPHHHSHRTGHNIPQTEAQQAEMDQGRKRLAVVHALIIRVNELHRAAMVKMAKKDAAAGDDDDCAGTPTQRYQRQDADEDEEVDQIESSDEEMR